MGEELGDRNDEEDNKRPNQNQGNITVKGVQ